MNPIYYETMKHKKLEESELEDLKELVMKLTPDDKPIHELSGRTARDLIRRRIGIIDVEQLMNAAEAKQRFETDKYRKSVNSFVGKNDILENLPNLVNRNNYKMLLDTATLVFNNSQTGDTIKIMADKVVIFCTYLNHLKNKNIKLYLDNDIILSAINKGLLINNDFLKAIYFIFNVLNGLNITASKRPENQPIEVIDGGYYKKNYRTSIKKKSRKLRSRR